MSASPASASAHSEKPNYGIDAPKIVFAFLAGGIEMLMMGLFLPRTVHIGPVRLGLQAMVFITGAIFTLEGALMLLYALVGKFKQRDFMLSKVQWGGDERVLDVGTGRGLLAIGAAKNLTSGHVVGIDIWKASDLSDNNMAATLRNVDLEGVREKLELLTEDASKMSFPDASFDVVLSNLCIHNIPKQEGRDAACREIARVIKPGGAAVISDFKNTARYAQVFREAGLQVERSAPAFLRTFPPLTTVTARK